MKKLAGLAFSIAVLAASAAAQTNTFPSSGNVGIGTTSPSNTLTIVGNANPVVMSLESTSSGGHIWGFASFGTYSGFSTGGLGVADWTAGAWRMYLDGSGNVGIGTTNPQYPLSVNGTIQAKEVLVNTGWSDYVFEPEYRVKPLTEVAAYIKAKHHLPDIPSEAEIKEKGVSVGEMEAKLLAKIEELTLQMIQLNEKNMALEKKVARLEGR